MSKTKLDIKLDEYLINAAREIKWHCQGRFCDNCIFLKNDVCVFGDVPYNWEVDNDKL